MTALPPGGCAVQRAMPVNQRRRGCDRAHCVVGEDPERVFGGRVRWGSWLVFDPVNGGKDNQWVRAVEIDPEMPRDGQKRKTQPVIGECGCCRRELCRGRRESRGRFRRGIYSRSSDCPRRFGEW